MGDRSRVRILGRGSTASVYLASRPGVGLVAVKSTELSHSAFLQNEQSILSSLPSSPHIISYLGSDITHEQPDGALYYNIIMEYAPGGSLGDLVRKQPLKEPAIRSYVYDIVSGLAYLHSIGIAHCDIKGQNILLASDGGAKIADLGCARRVGDGTRGGTPLYMAPEVARGEEHAQREPADIWAVACTVIEMATGRPPWPEISDPLGALHRIGFSSDTPELPRWLSDEGRDFLGKCLEREPKKRWTASQLLSHPFVAASRHCLSRISPKSVLDQGVLWDQEEDTGCKSDLLAERIRPLLCSIEGTWDVSSWVTVRAYSNETAEILMCPMKPLDLWSLSRYMSNRSSCCLPITWVTCRRISSRIRLSIDLIPVLLYSEQGKNFTPKASSLAVCFM